MAKKQSNKKKAKRKIKRTKGQTGGQLLAGAGRAKVMDDTTKLRKKERRDWKRKLKDHL